jgi:hypothetical protein
VLVYTWAMLPARTSQKAEVGLCADRDRAKKHVEEILGTDDSFLMGMVEQVSVRAGELEPGQWQPVGGGSICRRTSSGGFTWRPASDAVEGAPEHP